MYEWVVPACSLSWSMVNLTLTAKSILMTGVTTKLITKATSRVIILPRQFLTPLPLRAKPVIELQAQVVCNWTIKIDLMCIGE